jgi:hypothetical protein
VTRFIFASAALAAALAVTVSAQKMTPVHPGAGGSPHVRAEWTVDGANISIEYGRPFLKGRAIGKDLAPFGQVWRTGADEATTLTTDKPLTFGTVKLPAGTYTLYTLPGDKAWQLIINKQTGQPGTTYDQQQMPAGTNDGPVSKAPVEQRPFSTTTAQGRDAPDRWGTTMSRHHSRCRSVSAPSVTLA